MVAGSPLKHSNFGIIFFFEVGGGEGEISYHWVICQTLAHLPENFEEEESFSLFFLMVNTVG